MHTISVQNNLKRIQNQSGHFELNRGYYMTAQRYKFDLRVLNNVSGLSPANNWNSMFQHKKRNFISPSGHVIFYLLYKHQWNTTCKSLHKRHQKVPFSYVTIATLIFSCVKITCYLYVWRYHVFMQKLTWYFIGVYIINKIFLVPSAIIISMQLKYF